MVVIREFIFKNKTLLLKKNLPFVKITIKTEIIFKLKRLIATIIIICFSFLEFVIKKIL